MGAIREALVGTLMVNLNIMQLTESVKNEVSLQTKIHRQEDCNNNFT